MWRLSTQVHFFWPHGLKLWGSNKIFALSHLWERCVQSIDMYAVTAGISKSNSWTRNEPEQISSTSMYWYSLFSYNRDARYAKTSCQMRYLNTSWTSSVSGKCCSYCSDSAQLPQTMVISVPVSLCTGKVSRVLILECSCQGRMWTAFSVLCFTFFSWKVYPSVFFHSKWLILPSDVSLSQNGMSMLLCECIRCMIVSQPPNKTSCDNEEGKWIFRNSVPKSIFQWLHVKHPWKHPGIHMGGYLIPWGEVTSLSWSLFLLL